MKKLATKKGIASFYTVAFATLLLGVLAVGFTTVVVNEINRTTDFDLSKSAYDSALAGIEDAKVAVMNYKSCKAQNYTDTPIDTTVAEVTCGEIIHYMEHPDCYMVGHILGRIPKTVNSEVLIQEVKKDNGTTYENNMQQAYTCVEITHPNDIRATLTSENSTRVFPIKLHDADVSNINSIRISWSDNSGINYHITNYNDTFKTVTFPNITYDSASNPPTIAVQLVQTAPEFSVSDFTYSQGNKTDRGQIYLVPADGKINLSTSHKEYKSHIDATNDNYIRANEGFIKSNDKTSRNLPFLVNCSKDSDQDYLCSASIELPKPIGEGGRRSEETFTIIVSLPYGGPSTDVALSLCNGQTCQAYSTDENITTGDTSVAIEIESQLRIDSTGRANNLFRRIETRVETSENLFYNYTYDAIQALGDQDEDTVKKNVISKGETDLTVAPPKQCTKNYKLTFSPGIDMSTEQTIAGVSGVPGAIIECDNKFAVFNIPENVPYKAGYTFSGWSPSWQSTQVMYQPGGEYEANKEDSILYAMWNIQQFTIQYHNYNGANFGTPQLVRYGSSSTIYNKDSFATPISPMGGGFEIIGWSKEPNSTHVDFEFGKTFTPEADMDLYAVWRRSREVNFYQINGVNSKKTVNYYNGSNTASFSAPIIAEQAGWTVKGWGSSPSATEYSYRSQQANIQLVWNNHPHNSTDSYYAIYTYYAKAKYYLTNAGTVEIAGIPAESRLNLVTVTSRGPDGTVENAQKKNNGFKMPTAPTYTGYEFDAWHTSNQYASTPLQPGKVIKSTSDINVYAKWKYVQSTITFRDYDGNKFKNASNGQFQDEHKEVYTYNTPKAVVSASWKSTIKPSQTGFTLIGWTKTRGSTNVDYPDGTIVKNFTRDMTLYAVWKKTLTATFYQDGSTETKSGVLYNNQTRVAITTPEIPGVTGRTTRGWSSSYTSYNRAADSGGAMFIDSNKTYYAAYFYTVKLSYNPNGGTGTMADSTDNQAQLFGQGAGTAPHKIGRNITIKTNTFTRSGYGFKSWNLKTDGSSTLYNNGGTINIKDDTTIYAIWGASLNVVYYNSETGQAIKTQGFISGNEITILNSSIGSFSKTFRGWRKDSIGTSADIAAGSKQTWTSSVNLYSVSDKTYTAKFYGEFSDGAKVREVSVTIYNSAASGNITAPDVPAQSGFNVIGWSTSNSSVSNKKAGGATITLTSNPNYYAAYDKTVTVSFNANGGTGSIASKSGTITKIYKGTNSDYATTEVSITVPDNTFTLSGYNTNGWGTEATGGTAYANGATIKPTESITLYAQWEIIPYSCPNGITPTHNDPKGEHICIMANNNTYDSWSCDYYIDETVSCSSVGCSSWTAMHNGYSFSGETKTYYTGDHSLDYVYCTGTMANTPSSSFWDSYSGQMINYYTVTGTSCTIKKCPPGAPTRTTIYNNCPSGWNAYTDDNSKCYQNATRNN